MSDPIMKVLVTGADGFIGRRVMRDLAGRAIPSVAATRNGATFAGANSVTIGDMDLKSGWAETLDGVTHVVHLAGRAHVLRETDPDPEAAFHRTNAEATAKLAEAARASGVHHFILMSSIAVYDPKLEHIALATRTAPANAYGRSKLAAEAALKSAAGDRMSWTILRPPLVYGPEVKARFLQLLKLAALPLPLPLRGVHNLRSLIHAGNLSDVIFTVLDHPGTRNQTFLVSDGRDISTPDLVMQLARSMDHNMRLFLVPKPFLDLGANLLGHGNNWRKLTGTLTLDISHLIAQTGWMPPVSLADGLRETAQWYVKHRAK